MLNFRKQYYSSLGVKTVEVKPSVENALQGDVLSVDRLNKLCLWIRIPHFYRPIVWKLACCPVHRDSWEFVGRQRQEHFEALKEAVVLMTTKSLNTTHDDLTPELLVRMVLFELLDAPPSVTLCSDAPPPHLLALATAFLEICETSDEDAFWLLVHFVRSLRIDLLADSAGQSADKHSADIDTLVSLLDRHNPGLLAHIRRVGLSLHSACRGWFQCYFAGIIPSHALEGVWDILIGGAPGIMPYLGLSLLLSASRKIEACRTGAELSALIPQITKFVDVDSVANMSIDLWEIPVLERMSKESKRLLGYRV
ncbi:TBC1 domain member 7 [Polyrhizophydium stewartii]|uniref:TBC1 domain family member 7 n=1 Tax=Polyrhizophydium stewartii TaxID=2732419 RepID=A0ABR4NGT3_9FUNG